jgi:hypothetical protein
MKFSILPMESVFDINSEVSLEQNLAGVNAELMESSLFKTIHADLPIDQTIEVPDFEEKHAKLKALLETIGPAGFRADMIFFLKKWIISDFCLKYNFKRVFLGITAHKTATQLLAQLAKGRGASLCNDVVANHTDPKLFGDRHVIFCAPMRDFLQKEVGLFNYLNKVNLIHTKPIAQMDASKNKSK